jgi:hypothetical protein
MKELEELRDAAAKSKVKVNMDGILSWLVCFAHDIDSMCDTQYRNLACVKASLVLVCLQSWIDDLTLVLGSAPQWSPFGQCRVMIDGCSAPECNAPCAPPECDNLSPGGAGMDLNENAEIFVEEEDSASLSSLVESDELENASLPSSVSTVSAHSLPDSMATVHVDRMQSYSDVGNVDDLVGFIDMAESELDRQREQEDLSHPDYVVFDRWDPPASPPASAPSCAQFIIWLD